MVTRILITTFFFLLPLIDISAQDTRPAPQRGEEPRDERVERPRPVPQAAPQAAPSDAPRPFAPPQAPVPVGPRPIAPPTDIWMYRRPSRLEMAPLLPQYLIVPQPQPHTRSFRRGYPRHLRSTQLTLRQQQQLEKLRMEYRRKVQYILAHP